MTGNAGAKQPTIQAGLPIGLKTLPRKDFQTLRGIFGLLFGGRESFELPVAFDHTRFPIVLLRPARTPLRNVHAIYNIFILPASSKLRSEEFRIVPGKILARGAVHH